MGHITFSEAYDVDYVDWVSLLDTSPQDYESYLISGYKVLAQGDKKFQSNYVTVNYGKGNGELDPLQSALFQGVWGYAIVTGSHKFSTAQQVVNPNTTPANYSYGIRKLKVRGNGKVLQFKLSSVAGKPFWINGWTVFVTANPVV